MNYSHEFLQLGSGPDLDQSDSILRAHAFLPGITPLGRLIGVLAAKIFDGFVMLCALILQGDSIFGNKDVQMLTTQPIGACVLDDFCLRQSISNRVIQLGLSNPSLANTRDAHLLPHAVLCVSRLFPNKPDRLLRTAERITGYICR
jgi:hypothetical protein